MAVLPMFPLGTPLLPGSVLPLHVFEPRYVRMVQDILADDVDPPEFGVVMIERGHEVGGGDVRSGVGTVARILDMQVTPDGRYAVAAVGTDRIRVAAWLPDDPYPLADVDRWPDDDAASTIAEETIRSLHARVREINDLVREVGEMSPPPDTEISDDPRLALYHLAALSPLGAADRQRVLAAPGAADRVVVLAEVLDDAAAVLEFRRPHVIETRRMADQPPRPPSRQEPTSVGDVIETVKTYAKQETVDPLKRAGRYVGFGAAGGLLTGLGVALLLLGLLRLVQSEWSRSAEGRLSWLAYVITLVGALVLGALSAWFANRQIKKSILGKDEQ